MTGLTIQVLHATISYYIIYEAGINAYRPLLLRKFIKQVVLLCAKISHTYSFLDLEIKLILEEWADELSAVYDKKPFYNYTD